MAGKGTRVEKVRRERESCALSVDDDSTNREARSHAHTHTDPSTDVRRRQRHRRRDSVVAPFVPQQRQDGSIDRLLSCRSHDGTSRGWEARQHDHSLPFPSSLLWQSSESCKKRSLPLLLHNASFLSVTLSPHLPLFSPVFAASYQDPASWANRLPLVRRRRPRGSGKREREAAAATCPFSLSFLV